MTSKLKRTIVGVGIALGAAPACFGRTDVGSDRSPSGETDDDGTNDQGDARPPDAQPIDAGTPDRVEPTDAGAPDRIDPTDGSVPPDAAPDIDADVTDASSDASVDPFCDVSWPPTKGDPDPGRVACVDPLKECTDAWPPRQCYRLLAPFTCDPTMQRVGPLYCIGGQWQCPPGTDQGSRCRCYGPVPAGQTCTDAGLMPADAGGGE